jgi:hypothetical protein
MRLTPTTMIAAAVVLLSCLAARAEPVGVAPRRTFATRLPIAGEPASHYSKVTVDAFEWQPGEKRGRALVRLAFSAARPGEGADAPRDGWLRAVDEAGLVHLFVPLRSMESLTGADASVVFRADLPGARAALRLLLGPPGRPDGGVRIDLARKASAAFKPGREPPAISWPELERTARLFLPQPGSASFSPRLTIPLARAAATLRRGCLKDVDLLLPAAQLVAAGEGRGARLALVRVFVNRGGEAGCEVPNDLFYSDDTGALMPAAQAYLAAAPAFASYLDVVEAELPAHAERGHLFVCEASGETRTEVVVQLRVDLARRAMTLVEDVEGVLVDDTGKALPGVELWLRERPTGEPTASWRARRAPARTAASASSASSRAGTRSPPTRGTGARCATSSCRGPAERSCAWWWRRPRARCALRPASSGSCCATGPAGSTSTRSCPAAAPSAPGCAPTIAWWPWTASR